MAIVRRATHSLVLVAADLAGIGAGAAIAFRLLGKPNQVWLQLPLAVVISVASFCAWILCLRVFRWTRLRPSEPNDFISTLAVSLVWAPLIFVPLHYFTQGYLSSIGNLIALAIYQIPVNALALTGGRVCWAPKV